MSNDTFTYSVNWKECPACGRSFYEDTEAAVNEYDYQYCPYDREELVGFSETKTVPCGSVSEDSCAWAAKE